MITDRDICMAVFFQGVPMGEIRVSGVMSRQVFVCSADDDLEKIMSDKGGPPPACAEQGRSYGRPYFVQRYS
jgi:hypothetical protein